MGEWNPTPEMQLVKAATDVARTRQPAAEREMIANDIHELARSAIAAGEVRRGDCEAVADRILAALRRQPAAAESRCANTMLPGFTPHEGPFVALCLCEECVARIFGADTLYALRAPSVTNPVTPKPSLTPAAPIEKPSADEPDVVVAVCRCGAKLTAEDDGICLDCGRIVVWDSPSSYRDSRGAEGNPMPSADERQREKSEG